MASSTRYRRRIEVISGRTGGLVLLLAMLLGCDGQNELAVYAELATLEFADPHLTSCVRDTAERRGWTSAGQVDTLQCSFVDGEKIGSLEGIATLVNLQDLNLAHNRISDVSPLVGLEKLARLDLGFNEIEVIRALPRTLHVDLNHNRVRDLDWVSTSPAIRTLLIEYNDIAELGPLRQLEGLTELRLSGNHVRRLDGLESAALLKYLDASNNGIESVEALRNLRLMTLLQLSGNRIRDVSPLEPLKELRNLDLSGNQVQDVGPLSGLYNLKVLNLSDNPIVGIAPLLGLGELHELEIRATPALGCGEVREAIRVFGDRVVDADARCRDAPAPEGPSP